MAEKISGRRINKQNKASNPPHFARHAGSLLESKSAVD